jgi:uncharacterized protein (DUF302 family)
MHARTVTIVAVAMVATLSSVLLVARSTANRSAPPAFEDGIVCVKVDYALPEAVMRMQQDIATKGIILFATIDQAKLAADKGIALPPSTLLVFGNPALGSQFITSKAQAGLDWPVRVLVQEDESGQVWAAYSDFAWITRRHQINDRAAAFKMASNVVASIISSAQKSDSRGIARC